MSKLQIVHPAPKGSPLRLVNTETGDDLAPQLGGIVEWLTDDKPGLLLRLAPEAYGEIEVVLEYGHHLTAEELAAHRGET